MQARNQVAYLLSFALLVTSLGGQQVLVNAENGNGSSDYEAMEIAYKTPLEILQLRGFGGQTHNVRTKDGYFVNVINVIHPLKSSMRLKRPVIFNHGLIESAACWLVQSRDARPSNNPGGCENLPYRNATNTSSHRFINAPLMLANAGYDVWLMSMRGTDYSLHHAHLKTSDPKFWDFCLDDFALTDTPTVVNYVLRTTGASKVGYIGHSQATFSIFGLLSVRPEYADLIEPIVAVAPVAYVDHITSLARAAFVGILAGTPKSVNGPFPPLHKGIRQGIGTFCSVSGLSNMVCEVVQQLIAGRGHRFLKGYYTQMPFYSSLKVMRHFGQLVTQKRFGMYDYGGEENERVYGARNAPNYPVERIRSRSLCFISTRSDALSVPQDVSHLRRRLRVPLYRDIYINDDFSHGDLLLNARATHLVNAPILEIFESFEPKRRTCARGHD